MYIEIERLTKEEELELKEKFGERCKFVYDIYEEICKLELDVHIDNFIYEHNIEMSLKSKESIIESLCDNLNTDARDTIFQDLSEKTCEIVENYFDGMIE